MRKYQSKKRARRTRRSPIRLMAILLFAFLAVLYSYKLINASPKMEQANNNFESYQPESLPTNTIAPSFTQRALPTVQPTATTRPFPSVNINSTNAVLMDYKNGTILFDKNGAAKMYPASMVKIMTAIITLEHVTDLNEKVLLNEAMFQSIYSANASMAGFLPGEKVRVIDLLYGLLLPSGAECAVGLAEHVAGSESAFVTLMNEKAREIGMDSSNFTNSTGLHDINHYSTVEDIAVLFRYALANDTFYEIITSSKHSTPATNKHDGGITFYSTLFSKIDSHKLDGGTILGGKTGYTAEAGQCLASLTVKDGDKYILVTSGAAGNNQTEILNIEDAFTVCAAINR